MVLSPEVGVACTSHLVVMLNDNVVEVTVGLVRRSLLLSNLDERGTCRLRCLCSLNAVRLLESRADKDIGSSVDSDCWLLDLLLVRLRGLLS